MNEEKEMVLMTHAKLTPRGDGSFVLTPGKPQQWLWVKEAATAYRVTPKTVLSWWKNGCVNGRRVGHRKVQIEAESLRAFCEKEPSCGVA
jgi:hypothetical protein